VIREHFGECEVFQGVYQKVSIMADYFVCQHEEMGNAYKIFVEKLHYKRVLVKPRCRWKDNIETYPKRNTVRRCGL